MNKGGNVNVLFVAGFGPIVDTGNASQKLYVETLGLTFKLQQGGYLYTEELDGVKHFALWPLPLVAQACFDKDSWPAEVDFFNTGWTGNCGNQQRRNTMNFRTLANIAIISLGAWQAASAQSGKETNTPISCDDAATRPQYNETRGRMNDHESTQALRQSQTQPGTRRSAKAKITVQSSEAKPYDQTASPALMELRLSETFTGDIDGESPVRALQVLRDDKSACLVSMQRFRGRLGERQGTFVLQGSEIVENGKIKATWFVVPGSGTGDLSRLRGEGGFEGDFGKGSDGWLNYWFE
jgi:uncharacterized protein DUF3224